MGVLILYSYIFLHQIWITYDAMQLNHPSGLSSPYLVIILCSSGGQRRDIHPIFRMQ